MERVNTKILKVINTMGASNKIIKMEKGYIFGLMVLNMRDIGKIINLMVKELIIIKMVINTSNLSIIKRRGLG